MGVADFLLKAVVFLGGLSVLVLIHELGHLVVGRMEGIGALEFALGLPFTKPLWTKKLSSGMHISVYPLLFGGFVKLLGEEQQESGVQAEEKVAGKYFYQANVWQRVAVVVAGVVMNFILAVALFYIFLAASGFSVLVPRLAVYQFISPAKDTVVITYVQAGSPAAKAGMVGNEIVMSADGRSFSQVADFQKYVKSRAGYPVVISLESMDFSGSHSVTVTPRLNPPAGQGSMGVGVDSAVALSFTTPVEKIISGFSYGVDMLLYNLKVVGHLALSSIQSHNVAPLAENVSGPVGIAGAFGTIVDLGGSQAVVTLINFLGLLSISLAFINILPIPATDGGRLVFLLVEALFGKKLATEKENLINQVGMVLILALFILITFNDVSKLLTDSGILKAVLRR